MEANSHVGSHISRCMQKEQVVDMNYKNICSPRLLGYIGLRLVSSSVPAELYTEPYTNEAPVVQQLGAACGSP